LIKRVYIENPAHPAISQVVLYSYLPCGATFFLSKTVYIQINTSQ